MAGSSRWGGSDKTAEREAYLRMGGAPPGVMVQWMNEQKNVCGAGRGCWAQDTDSNSISSCLRKFILDVRETWSLAEGLPVEGAGDDAGPSCLLFLCFITYLYAAFSSLYESSITLNKVENKSFLWPFIVTSAPNAPLWFNQTHYKPCLSV